MNYTVIRNDELYHHGILGQKWGVRRYQNEDGSLTEAGKRRYGTNLDLSDKSRKNIAKIRLGEARRRLDVAKNNSENKGRNDPRVAELQARVRSAKRAVRMARKIDRGAELEAKGKTVTRNKLKAAIFAGAATLSNYLFLGYLDTRLDALKAQGKWTEAHYRVAASLALAGTVSSIGLTKIYASHLNKQSFHISEYNRLKQAGETTISSIGSQEYKDVIERNKKKSK